MKKGFHEMYYGTNVKTNLYQSTLVTELPHFDVESNDLSDSMYYRLSKIQDESIVCPLSKMAIINELYDLNDEDLNDEDFRELVREINFKMTMRRYHALPLRYVDSLANDKNFIRNEYLSVINTLNEGKYNSTDFGTIIYANGKKTFNVVFTDKQLNKLKLCNIKVYENLPHLFFSCEGYVTKHYGRHETFHIFRSIPELGHTSYNKVFDFIMSNAEKVTIDMDI